jgi:hypothetical protein
MKLYVDHYCEIADVLAQYITAEFYGFEHLTIEPDAVYIVGRTQLMNNAATIRQLVTEENVKIIFSNPAEGSETFVQHLRQYGVEDLVLSGALPCITGGPLPEQYPHIVYEHFLTQPFRYAENRLAAAQSDLIYRQEPRPYDFLFLNGRYRPHRRALINELESLGLLDRALWTCLDGQDRPIQLLPEQYEVPQFRSTMNTSGQGFVKNQLFNNLWGEIYIHPAPYTDSYFSLVTETVYGYPHSFRTEKIAKPLCAGHPFIVAANPGFYRDLRNMGFQTFDHLIDESFDTLDNDTDRLNRLVATVRDLCASNMLQFIASARDVCKYNQQHLQEQSIRWQRQLPERFFSFLNND